MDDLVLLDVQDDGVGLNGAQPSPFGGGFGLEAMRERAAMFGGKLLISKRTGRRNDIGRFNSGWYLVFE
ncbi:hypothetical protein MNBD_CHLOROFLEXI01-3549 [hydrothermal vent metagenome]|uniref:Histidine kinase/HSP90-like ATPase domain-containing protein n=1 Tax=hydrothermal vent metagenome TaxID=652676 RepID=A0A3B0VE81_9ZZZZ